MIYHLFLGSVATVILNPEFVTVIEFNHRVTKQFSSIPKSTVFKKLSNDKRTLVLKPLVPTFKGNLVVMTEGGTYNFDLVNGAKPHRSITVVNGVNDNNYKLIKEKGGIKYYGSSSSLLLKNESSASVKINHKTLKSGEHFVLPKGPPVFVNSLRVRFE